MEEYILRLIQTHYRARPSMQLQDVYKLLYQAHMGIGHLVNSSERALDGIRQEMAEAPEVPWVEALWEDISPVGAVGRVNLRPFRAQNLDPEALAQALFIFAHNPPGDVHQLARSWEEVGRLIGEGQLEFKLDDYQSFASQILRDAYPAMHHSRAYAETYKPAYRILSKELFCELFPRI